MDMLPPTGDRDLVTYHYVMSLKAHLGGANYAEFDSYGTVHIRPGTSRREVFEDLRAKMIDDAIQQGLKHHGVTTVFWSLEPDTLG